MSTERAADVAGIHACRAALDAGELQRVLLIEGKLNRRQQELLDDAQRHGLPVERGSTTELLVAAPGGLKHQGVVGWCRKHHARPAHALTLEDLLQTVDAPLFLVLDGVEDPRNLGACLRSADGAGVDAVILPRSRGAPMSAIVRKTAAGAVEALPILEVANLSQALEKIQQAGVQVIGLADEADAELYAMDLRSGLAVVMGNEGQGMRRLTREHCDAIASLPMRGHVSSLNVSVATGIVLYEAQRQRSQFTSTN